MYLGDLEPVAARTRVKVDILVLVILKVLSGGLGLEKKDSVSLHAHFLHGMNVSSFGQLLPGKGELSSW